MNTQVTVHAFGGDGARERGFRFCLSVCIQQAILFPVLRQLTAMIFGGIPELFPKLKISTSKSAAAGCPTGQSVWMRSGKNCGKIEAPLCKKKPSEYLTSENIYYGCEPEEKMISYVVGGNRLKDPDVRFGLSALGYELAGIGVNPLESARRYPLDVKKDLLLQ